MFLFPFSWSRRVKEWKSEGATVGWPYADVVGTTMALEPCTRSILFSAKSPPGRKAKWARSPGSGCPTSVSTPAYCHPDAARAAASVALALVLALRSASEIHFGLFWLNCLYLVALAAECLYTTRNLIRTLRFLENYLEKLQIPLWIAKIDLKGV